MLGAIIGDMAGSVYEMHNIHTTEFPFYHPFSQFTDDTVLTVALAESLLTGEEYARLLKSYFRRYPRAGFGGAFIRWAQSPSYEPYYSYGNGSAMRVSPIGWAYDTLEETLEQAEKSAAVTHNHPEGIQGAKSVASAVFLARQGESKAVIRDYCENAFGYELSQSIEWLRVNYTFDVSCQGSVPQAIIAFLESDNFEDAVRKAISIGGDSDTIACIAGAIAHGYYRDIPSEILKGMYDRLDAPMTETVRAFSNAYGCDPSA
jgi:ADP-ribosylglycohydrolase